MAFLCQYRNSQSTFCEDRTIHRSTAKIHVFECIAGVLGCYIINGIAECTFYAGGTSHTSTEVELFLCISDVSGLYIKNGIPQSTFCAGLNWIWVDLWKKVHGLNWIWVYC